MSNIEKIKKKFNEIKLRGFLPSIAEYEHSNRNDGDAGETFQYYFYGKGRDNSKEADWEGWEIKSSRDTSTSLTSLFSSKPSFPENGDKYMLEKWGIPHEIYPNLLKLNTTLYAHRYSKVHIRTLNVPTYLMKIKNDRIKKKISLVVCDENKLLLDDSVYWSYELIKDRFKKLQNTIYVEANEKTIDGKVHFKYVSAKLLLESNLESFLRCVDEGIISYDHKWDVDTKGKRAGELHNHGGGFRIVKGKWMSLASEIIDI